MPHMSCRSSITIKRALKRLDPRPNFRKEDAREGPQTYQSLGIAESRNASHECDPVSLKKKTYNVKKSIT